jgi:photosystem II stability/assembly factor-like uncharacterized protein
MTTSSLPSLPRRHGKIAFWALLVALGSAGIIAAVAWSLRPTVTYREISNGKRAAPVAPGPSPRGEQKRTEEVTHEPTAEQRLRLAFLLGAGVLIGLFALGVMIAWFTFFFRKGVEPPKQLEDWLKYLVSGLLGAVLGFLGAPLGGPAETTRVLDSTEKENGKKKEEAGARPKKGKGRDDPMAMARFLHKLRGARAGGDPMQAMPRAIRRVREMRQEVATRSGVRASVLAALTARGARVVTVAGIPVGPLAADSPAAARIAITPRNFAQLAVADVKTLEKTAQPLAVPLASQITPGGWVWLGPGNAGGRTRAILVHPNDPKTMWMGGATGGIWTTHDGGTTWAPYKVFMASLVVSCMVVDRNNPNVLFAGTGEGFFNIEASSGAGIFRTSNGGADWSLVEGTQGREDFRWVNRLAMSPDSKTLLVATRAGLFRGTAADDWKDFPRGQLQAGGGEPQPFTAEALDVRFHPTDNLRAVAGGRNGKAWFTEDGGKTWQQARGLPEVKEDLNGRVELVYAAADPKRVYACLDELAFQKIENEQPVDYYGHVFLSRDGGKSYALRNKLGHLGDQGWYANCLWAGDPADPNLLVVGGLNLHRSIDGGTTFAQISDWRNSPRSPHADHHVIVADPNYDGKQNKRVFFGNDGGIYATDDIGVATTTSGWRTLNNGVATTQLYGAAGQPRTGKIIAGAQDNGTLIYTPPQVPPIAHEGINDWFDHGLDDIPGSSGDGGFCAADPEEPIFYGEHVRLRIHRGNGTSRPQSIDHTILDARSEKLALFIAPFVLAPDDPKVMFAGGSRLWRCANVRASEPQFEMVKEALLKKGDDSEDPVKTLISAIAVQRGGKVVWVGQELNDADQANSGAVFRTDDVTAAEPRWVRVGLGNQQGKGKLPERHCTRLVIDPRDARTIYALYGGYFANNLWRSSDGGKNWAAVTKVLPEAPAFDLALHPDDSNILVLGTEVGLFVSADAGKTWSPTSQGPTNCAVYQLFWMGKTLVAVTHGRGLFTIDLSNGAHPSATRNKPAKPLTPKPIRP